MPDLHPEGQDERERSAFLAWCRGRYGDDAPESCAWRAGFRRSEARQAELERERDEARFLAEARGIEKDRHRREKLVLEAREAALIEALRDVRRLINTRSMEVALNAIDDVAAAALDGVVEPDGSER